MKAVLLAAGVGRRLGVDRPKALLEVGDRTLLSRHLEQLDAAGIPVRIVTGYKAGMLSEHAPGRELVFNDEYERGSLLSLARGLDGLADDVLVMDADVLYEPSILHDVTRLTSGFAIDPRTDPGEEEMMIGVLEGRVRAIRRGRLEGFDLVGEGVGFFKIDAASLDTLRACVEEADPDGDYEAALDAFVRAFGADYVDVGGRPWTEIDFPEDVTRAEREILPALDAR